MEPRGRGRARGRARGGGSGSGYQEPRPGPPQQGGPPQFQGASGGTRGSRGRARGAPSMQQPVQMAAAAPTPRPWGARSETQAPPPTQATQRPERFEPPGRMDTTPRSMETGAGDGESSTSRGGNGGVRGRTLRSEYVYTKPQTVTRKQGSSGTIVNLSANYFKLLEAGKWGLNQYRVDFNPDIDHTGQRKALMRVALQNVLTGYLFDGTVLYTPHTIHPDPMEKLVQNNNEERIIISVRRVGDVAWGDYHYIHLFNIIIRKCFNFMKFELIQRDYYDPHSKVVLKDHNLEIWPGFCTSMRQHEADILMNCNVTFKVVRTENVYDLLAHCNSSGNPRANFRMSIIGIVVLTYYNNKSYRIDDVDYNTSPTSTFPMRDGTQISFIDYYKKKYNINIQNARQPMLVSRSSAREIRSGMSETVLLIPELCQMTGLTDQQRENFHLMKSLADHTRIAPNARINKLKQFSDRMARCPEAMAELKRWDLNIAKDLIKFQGRVLNPEAIIGGNNAKYSAGNQADWTRELRNLPMFEAGVLSRLAVLCPSKFVSNCQEFMRCLQRAASGMSWSIGQYKVIELHGDRTQNYLESIESVINADKPSMIMCIVPNNNSDRYSSIKKKLIVDRGVPSQIILAKNLASKGVMSIATKVAIQLNCKVGGAPWTVAMPLSNLMIVGYDVCRDTANKGKCFAAMVASLNKQATRYYNQTFEHMQEQELSDNFGAFMRLACMKYKELNGQYPDRILIYRDGVGEGQLPYVLENEVVNIKKKLTAEIYKDKELKLAFVVVNKRINTRIFTSNETNPSPGTVVDDVITQPERYDFYIVSQCVRQGTVTPTSYNVIEDTMGLPPDRMQMLTYKMCHMYYNWSGTVRVPAPCQYAHKLAFLTAQSLHRAAHRTLEDILYYL